MSRVHTEDRGYDTKCLIWDGEKDKEGYGRIKYRSRYVPAHWVMDGKPPKGYVKDHLCHQRDCVRPSHVENVTVRENTIRRDTLGRRTRITPEERSAASAMLATGDSLEKVAKATGLSRRTLGRIRDEQDR
jgi:hypothetical protein